MKRETRTSDEKRLIDYLKHHYDQQVIGVKPVRGVMKIKTEQGTYALKRVDSKDKECWRLIEELSTHLRGKFYIPAPVQTKSGQQMFDGFQHKYVLLPWISAKPLSFRTTSDWIKASRELAVFHQYNKDFSPVHNYRQLNQAENWSRIWKNAHRHMELYHLAAKWTREPTQTDESWLEVAGYSMSLLENLIRYREKLGGNQLIRSLSEFGKVCHGKLRRHHFLMDHQEQQIHLVGWDHIVLDNRTTDLAQYLITAYRRTGSGELLAKILREYQKVTPLVEEEYALIYTRLLYPERLIRVLRSVYEDQTLPLTAGAPSIFSAAKLEEDKISLIKHYVEMLQSEFQVTIPQIEWMKR